LTFIVDETKSPARGIVLTACGVFSRLSRAYADAGVVILLGTPGKE
jgi:hypothetical protein